MPPRIAPAKPAKALHVLLEPKKQQIGRFRRDATL